MALTNETIFGYLTPQLGQATSQTLIDVLKLATNAANAIYNLDLPLNSYQDGQQPVALGYELDSQPDLRFTGGMPQPYASDSGYILQHTQVSTVNGFKGGIFVNSDTNTVVISFAGMDGIGNGQDQASGVVWNGSNQFTTYANDQQNESPPLRNALLEMVASGAISSDTKIIFAGQSMGTALAIMAAADFIHNVIPISDLRPSNVVLVGENGLGVPDRVLEATAGVSNSELAASGISRIFLVNGDILHTGLGDIVSPLNQYPLLDGEGVIQVDGFVNSNGGVSAYHSIQTSIFGGLLNLIENPDSVLIRQHQTFDADTAIAIAQFVGSLGSDGSTLSAEEGYLRTALGGVSAMALSAPGEAGSVLGAALGELLGSPALGNVLGYLAEFATKVLFLENPIVFAEMVLGGLGITKVSNLLNSVDPAKLQQVTTSLSSVADALTLLQAIQTGKPLPVVVSGLRLANDVTTLANNGIPYTNLSGAANVGSGILSLMSLNKALKQGDTLAAVTAGAQTVYFGATAYANFLDYTTDNAGSAVFKAFGADSAFTQLGNALPYLNLVNDIVHGNDIGVGLDVLAITVPTIGVPLSIAYNVFNMVTSLFGGHDDIPDPWGNGHYVWNGTNITYQSVGETGGNEAVSNVMSSVLSTMNALIERERQQNPGSQLGIIPNRMPSVAYDMSGYRYTDIDPLSGAEQHPYLRFDTSGNPYNATPGSPESYQSIVEGMVYSALSRGAIAPLWEVRTAAIQTQYGDPKAGLTEEERAGRDGMLAAPLTGATQIFRPVMLDLDGDGIETVGKNASGVAFDVDDSGFLKATGWATGGDAFLTLDRDYNGQTDSGREMFSNSVVDLSRRGLAGMAWVDSNYDGRLTAIDPVWN